MTYNYINIIDDYIRVEHIGDYGDCYSLNAKQVKEIIEEFESKEQLIEELKLQIKHLQKRNYTLKSLLLSKLPNYVHAVLDFL